MTQIDPIFQKEMYSVIFILFKAVMKQPNFDHVAFRNQLALSLKTQEQGQTVQQIISTVEQVSKKMEAGEM